MGHRIDLETEDLERGDPEEGSILRSAESDGDVATHSLEFDQGLPHRPSEHSTACDVEFLGVQGFDTELSEDALGEPRDRGPGVHGNPDLAGPRSVWRKNANPDVDEIHDGPHGRSQHGADGYKYITAWRGNPFQTGGDGGPMADPAAGRPPSEDPYHEMLRLQEEAAGWEVKAHKVLLEARKLEAKAARLSLKARKIADQAEAHIARSQSIEGKAWVMLHEDQSADKDLKVEKSHQLEFEAESLRLKAKGVESEAAQLRIAARAKIAESTRFLQEAKRLVAEAEAFKARF